MRFEESVEVRALPGVGETGRGTIRRLPPLGRQNLGHLGARTRRFCLVAKTPGSALWLGARFRPFELWLLSVLGQRYNMN